MLGRIGCPKLTSSILISYHLPCKLKDLIHIGNRKIEKYLPLLLNNFAKLFHNRPGII